MRVNKYLSGILMGLITTAFFLIAACGGDATSAPTRAAATSPPAKTQAPTSVPTAVPAAIPSTIAATATPRPTIAPSPTAEPAMMEEVAPDLVVKLTELNGSGQTGQAAFTAMGEQTKVVLAATEGVSKANHIHQGSCQELGGIAHGLTPMEDGVSETVLDVGLDSLRTGGLAINLPSAEDISIYTSCGNIPPAAESVTLVLSQLGFGNCLRKRLRLPPFFRSVDVGGWQPWDENGMWSGWKGKKETSWND